MNTFRRSVLPPITDLAARVRDGEDLASIAAQYGVTPGRLQERFTLSGFSSTGVSAERAKGADLKAHLASVLKTWREPWMEYASCASVDPVLWFPEKGESQYVKQARAICSKCPVIDNCRDYAVSNRERFGIWANTSERDRRKLFREAS